MRPVYSSILLPLLLFSFVESYPAAASDSEDMDVESLARLLDKYEKLESYNMDAYMDEGKKLAVDSYGMGKLASSDENKIKPFNDYPLNKRAPSRPKYNYYKCYFNPVTCYGK